MPVAGDSVHPNLDGAAQRIGYWRVWTGLDSMPVTGDSVLPNLDGAAQRIGSCVFGQVWTVFQ